MLDVTPDDGQRTDGRTDGRNVKIELEFWKQNSQYATAFGMSLFLRSVQKATGPSQKAGTWDGAKVLE